MLERLEHRAILARAALANKQEACKVFALVLETMIENNQPDISITLSYICTPVASFRACIVRLVERIAQNLVQRSSL